MKYKIIKEYSDSKFRRITGVNRTTFGKMVEILQKAYAAKHKRRGRKAKLCIEEDTLIKDGIFSLPGRKTLLKSNVKFDVVLIDATESPIERPKRGKNSGILGRKSGTQ